MDSLRIVPHGLASVATFYPPAHEKPQRCGEVAYNSSHVVQPAEPAERKMMGWATGYIQTLRQGEAVSFRPRGNSMSGKIESGQLCEVEPVEPEAIRVGDIVLCKVNGREYLHLVKAIQGARFQIGNNRGRINGWVTANSIYGRLAKVSP